MFAQQAQERRLDLIVDLDPQCPRLVHGDDMRFRQILVNLVGNAVKFTDAGHIVVQLEMAAVSPRESRLHVAVSDTGRGIAPEMREFLFSPFTQADASGTQNLGGTGLGLVISQRLVHMMGGGIDYESDLGVGSSFHFDIPLLHAEKTESILAPCDEDQRTDVCLVSPQSIQRRSLARASSPSPAPRRRACWWWRTPPSTNWSSRSSSTSWAWTP
jgi:K+-sensing histidine kinase KdpD